MCQAEVAGELLRRFKARKAHTAVETNLSFPWTLYEKALEWIDLVMFDIKHMDEQKHLEGTGLSNRSVLENARRLSLTGKPFIARTPVIPGYNDSEQNIDATAAFLRDMPGLLYYELLSYNPLGEEKRAMLGKPAERGRLRQDRETVRHLARVASACGVPVYLDGPGV